MAASLTADMTVLRERDGVEGKVAEVLIRRFAREDFLEIRIAVVGNVDSGKSTLLGVLTRGQLDNGRGLARMNIFRHKHEIESGRTSSISQEIMGFDSKGKIVNYSAVHAGMDDQEICEQSAKIITFIDLAGHEKYLRTTLFGLTGHAPDFAMLMVGANMGIVGMTKEHLGITLALRVPVYIVITKVDMCPENILKETLQSIKKLLKSPGSRKIPVVIRTEDDVVVAARNFVSERIAPIFCVSNVTGQSLDLLRMFLNLLPARKEWEKLYDKPAQLDIDATWAVPGVGTVISGTMMSGTILVNDSLLLGPDSLGEFQPVVIKSIHTKRMPVRMVRAGQTASLALKKIKRSAIRKGMVLIAKSTNPVACREFEAEILVLYHQTTIQKNYEAVVHCGTAQQCAKILNIDKGIIRTGDKAKVRFRFASHPEYLVEGTRLIFREGRAKGIGRVVTIFPTTETEKAHAVAPAAPPRHGHGSHKHPAGHAAPAHAPRAHKDTHTHTTTQEHAGAHKT
jgi:GTPase